MKVKNIEGLDDLFYYVVELDTSFVLIGFETNEQFGNGIYYKFTPVYGLYEQDYYLPVAYFESFNQALEKYHIIPVNDVRNLIYNFEKKDM